MKDEKDDVSPDSLMTDFRGRGLPLHARAHPQDRRPENGSQLHTIQEHHTTLHADSYGPRMVVGYATALVAERFTSRAAPGAQHVPTVNPYTDSERKVHEERCKSLRATNRPFL